MKAHALRLSPGDDLRRSLLAFAAKEQLLAGFIFTTVGSLSVANLRFAGLDGATQISRDLEILSLVGTLGGESCHLHLTVSDATGAVLGGHLLDGSLVRTTAEIVVGVLPDLEFRRVFDPATGFNELDIRPH